MRGCGGAGVRGCAGAEVRGCGGAKVRGCGGVNIALAACIMARDFTELAAWQLSNELRQLILSIVARPNVRTDFKYCDQCKDAARSAASNIAEGFGRCRHKEFAHFLDYSIGSLKELHDLLIDGHSRGYVSDEELTSGVRLSKRAKAACAALAAYLRRTPDPRR